MAASEIQFQEPGQEYGYNYQRQGFKESSGSKLVQWVIKHSGGLVKNEKQANYVLLGFVILAIIVSLVLVLTRKGIQLPPEEEIFRDTPPPPLMNQ